jgi:hypothetical protein
MNNDFYNSFLMTPRKLKKGNEQNYCEESGEAEYHRKTTSNVNGTETTYKNQNLAREH